MPSDTGARKRSFLDSYQTTDIAEDHVIQQLTTESTSVRKYGDDRRHEELDFKETNGDPDLRVDDSEGNALAFVEVKAKQSEDWMFITNQYAFDEYVSHAQTYSPPTYVVWCHVNEQEGEIYDTQFLQVKNWEQVERTFSAPDGTIVVALDDQNSMGLKEFQDEIGCDET